jgi:hypothetical protein
MRKTMLALALATVAGGALAAEKTYQVTGPVVEVRDDAVVVQKGKENWEIARTGDTKVTGDLKKGEKVTVKYKMTATSIDVAAATKKKAK